MFATITWSYLAAAGLRHDLTSSLGRASLAAFALVAVACALAWRCVERLEAALVRPSRRAFRVTVLAVGVALTLWFHRGPMRGALLARDSAVYWLQARALAHGAFGVAPTTPRPAAGAHFLFEGHDGRLHGVFAPGYPLFLAPFTRAGGALAAALVTAALFALAHERLARAVLRDDERAVRLAMLLPLASLARTTETADLLSHAFVATLAALAFSLSVDPPTADDAPARRWRWGLALGVVGGWLFAARMLDGMLLALSLAPLFVGRFVTRARDRRALVGALAWALVPALAFVALVTLQQRAATGSYRVPTSVAYARNADYPSTCLRLGFGRDVGCRVEHRETVSSFGPDGYTPRAALRVVRERASVLGIDLFGASWLSALVLLAGARRRTRRVAWLAVFPLVLTVGYALFYYGNAPLFGARHLYPAAPFLYVLAAALALPRRRAHAPLAPAEPLRTLTLAPATLVAVAITVPARVELAVDAAIAIQRPREPLRRALEDPSRPRGVYVTADLTSYLAALDPWADRGARVLAPDDHAGNFELRRAYRGWPVYVTAPDGAVRALPTPPPPPGFDLELERLWPSNLRVERLGAAPLDLLRCCRVDARGNHVLFLFEAAPGASLEGTFDVAEEGSYALTLLGVTGPDHGDYDVYVDGTRVGRWTGYDPRVAPRRLALDDVGSLTAGPHRVRFVCVGRDARSRGFVAGLDALTGRARTP